MFIYPLLAASSTTLERLSQDLETQQTAAHATGRDNGAGDENRTPENKKVVFAARL